MNRENRETARYRCLKAVTVVLALLVAAPGIDAVVRMAGGPQEAIAAVSQREGLNAGELVDATDAFGSLERLEKAAGASQSAVSEEFEREIGLLPGAQDVRVSERGDVVGYVVPGDCEAVIGRIADAMLASGWAGVPLSGVTGATFVKPSGSCTWALVTCTQIRDMTSVVVRCVMQ